MIKLFIDENDEIVVSIVVATNKSGDVFADPERDKEDLINLLGLDIDGEIEKYTIIFKKPSFKDMNNISSDRIDIGSEGKVKIDIFALREAKLKKLIKKWDFKDEEGKDVEVSDESINNLHPSIAAALGSELDRITGGIVQ